MIYNSDCKWRKTQVPPPAALGSVELPSGQGQALEPSPLCLPWQSHGGSVVRRPLTTRVVGAPKAGECSSCFKGVQILAAPREEPLSASILPSFSLTLKILIFFLLTIAINACDTKFK